MLPAAERVLPDRTGRGLMLVLGALGMLAIPNALAAQQPEFSRLVPPGRNILAPRVFAHPGPRSPAERTLRLQSPRADAPRDWAPRWFWEPGHWIPPSGVVMQTLDQVLQHELVAWPVVSEPWEHRPWEASFRLAAFWGDNIISKQLRLETDALWEFSLARRWKPYWTWELRWAWSQPKVTTYPGAELPRADVILFDLAARRTVFESRHWRWSLLLGVGGATFSLIDVAGVSRDQTVWQFPMGLGMEYRWDDHLSLTMQLRNHMVLGDGFGLETMHLVSLGLGLEYRFGGSVPSYWPWTPSP